MRLLVLLLLALPHHCVLVFSFFLSFFFFTPVKDVSVKQEDKENSRGVYPRLKYFSSTVLLVNEINLHLLVPAPCEVLSLTLFKILFSYSYTTGLFFFETSLPSKEKKTKAYHTRNSVASLVND